MRTRLGLRVHVPRPTLPRFSTYWEENIAALTITIYDLHAEGLDDVLARVELELTMSPWLADFLDWLLPDRREWHGGRQAAPKGWMRHRGAS